MGGTIVQKLMRLRGLCHIMSAHHISQLNESKEDQESQQRCKTAFHSGLRKRDFKKYKTTDILRQNKIILHFFTKTEKSFKGKGRMHYVLLNSIFLELFFKKTYLSFIT